MLIFGDIFNDGLPFYEIISSEDLKNTPSNSTVLFDYDEKLAKYCKDNSVSYAMRVKSIKELVYANALECDFAFVDKEFAKTAQDIANEYMFDMKIILSVTNDKELEWAAMNGIDGVWFRSED
jgi:hypothetical protein